jgi:hypothetical protein
MFTLREKCRIGVFDNRGARGVYVADKYEIIGGNGITRNFLKCTLQLELRIQGG